MKKSIRTTLAIIALSSCSAFSFAQTPQETPKQPAPVTTPAKTAAPAPANEPASKAQGLINLNTADVTTLDHELSGIGAVKAKAIVDYRDANGPFKSVDELLEVKGIGQATLEKNRSKLSVE